MSDSYQAIYDAVRSRISGADVGAILRDAVRDAFDVSHQTAMLSQQFYSAALEMQRPSAIFRPVLSIDGNKWYALYGENLHDGVAGFGDTPDEAMREFDKAWHEKLTPIMARERAATERDGRCIS